MTYRIVGADGKVYGPVTDEQLRAWVRDGRVDARTQVLGEGGAAWQTMSERPEFADLFPQHDIPPGIPPEVPPVTTPGDAEAIAREVLARGYELDVGRCIGRAWDLVKSDFWLLVGAAFVGYAVAEAVPLILYGPMMGGLYFMYLRKIRGERVTFGDAFAGFSLAFVPLMLAAIVSGLLGFLGLLLCIVPGIYLFVCWVFTLPLVLDKRLDFWPAMELSRKVVSMHWWSVFALIIVLTLFALLGLLACCVGVFVTGAVAEVALVYAYEDIFGARRQDATE